MATFSASGFISGNTLLSNILQDYLQSELPVIGKYSSTRPGSPDFSTTTSWGDLVAHTITAEDDEAIFIFGTASVSMSNAGDSLDLKLENTTDAVDVGLAVCRFTEDTARTTGESTQIALIGYDTNRSGSTSYKLRWRKNSGSGTMYTRGRDLLTVQLKRRA